MAASVFREKQKLVQAELNRVVGPSRSPCRFPSFSLFLRRSVVPSFADMVELPYTQAFASEVFRWRPISSGINHQTTEELLYVRRADALTRLNQCRRIERLPYTSRHGDVSWSALAADPD